MFTREYGDRAIGRSHGGREKTENRGLFVCRRLSRFATATARGYPNRILW